MMTKQNEAVALTEQQLDAVAGGRNGGRRRTALHRSLPSSPRCPVPIPTPRQC